MDWGVEDPDALGGAPPNRSSHMLQAGRAGERKTRKKFYSTSVSHSELEDEEARGWQAHLRKELSGSRTA
jgi:hypothetical protein